MVSTEEQIKREVQRRILELERDRPPNPFGKWCSRISTPFKLDDDPALRSEDPIVRLAFVSLERLNDSDRRPDFVAMCGSCKKPGAGSDVCLKQILSGSNKPGRKCHRGVDPEALQRTLYRPDSQRARQDWRKYKAALSETFAAYSPNVVMVNELGIPATSSGPTPGLFRRAGDMARKQRALIIAGSFHDTRTKCNTGYVFGPKSGLKGAAFHKQVSAVRVTEAVSVPPKRHSVIVQAFHLNIGVVVCLDLLDYSSIAPLVNLRAEIDLVLVPSHTPNAVPLETVAALASQAMPGGVGIVNYDCGRGKSSSLHLFGVRQSPVADRKLKDAVGRVAIYDVDFSGFVKQKRATQNQIGYTLGWLFPGPPIEQAGPLEEGKSLSPSEVLVR